MRPDDPNVPLQSALAVVDYVEIIPSRSAISLLCRTVPLGIVCKARLLMPYIGLEVGAVALPAIGDEVLIIFPGGNLNCGIAFWGLYNGVDKVPLEAREGLVLIEGRPKEDLKIHVRGHVDILVDGPTNIMTLDRVFLTSLGSLTANTASTAALNAASTVLVNSGAACIVNAAADASITAGGAITVSSGGLCAITAVADCSITAGGACTVAAAGSVAIAAALNTTVTATTVTVLAGFVDVAAPLVAVQGVQVILSALPPADQCDLIIFGDCYAYNYFEI